MDYIHLELRMYWDNQFCYPNSHLVHDISDSTMAFDYVSPIDVRSNGLIDQKSWQFVTLITLSAFDIDNLLPFVYLSRDWLRRSNIQSVTVSCRRPVGSNILLACHRRLRRNIGVTDYQSVSPTPSRLIKNRQHNKRVTVSCPLSRH